MRISDWSSDVCSSDLRAQVDHQPRNIVRAGEPFEAVDEARAGGEADPIDIGEGQAVPIVFDQLALRGVVSLDKVGSQIIEIISLEREGLDRREQRDVDRKSTRLNSSH